MTLLRRIEWLGTPAWSAVPDARRAPYNVTKLRASDGANLGTFAAGIRPIGFTFDGANVRVVNHGSDTVPASMSKL